MGFSLSTSIRVFFNLGNVPYIYAAHGFQFLTDSMKQPGILKTIILTGDPGSGKSTFLDSLTARLQAAGYHIGGITAPCVDRGSRTYDLLDIESGKSLPLSTARYVGHWEKAGGFYFNPAAIEAGLAPTRVAVYHDPEVQDKMPHLQYFLPAFEKARPRPVSPLYPMMSQELQRFFSHAISQPKTDVSALAKATSAKLEKIVQMEETLQR